MKKILILGDYENYPYHPFAGVDTSMTEIIGAAYQITCTGDYQQLCQLEQYDLFICYTDCWLRENLITDAQAAGLITYVANGGKCLIVHSGLSLQIRSEFIAMFGAKFLEHPKKTDIMVSACQPDEAITKGLAPFTTNEEPYQFAFDENAKVTLLTEYCYEGKQYPHSWKKKYCKGEVVFLMGGHSTENFAEEGNRILLQNAVAYLLG